MNERFTSASRSTLPKASAVITDGDTFKQVVGLLKKLTSLKVKSSELKEQTDTVTGDLAAICAAYNIDKGFKHGMSGFEYHGYVTRKTLSKEKLLAAGVAADVIADAYNESDPFLSCRLIAFDIE